jgi:hypothetical protein
MFRILFSPLCKTTAFKLLILESVTENFASMLQLLAMFRKLQDFVNFGEKLSKWNTQAYTDALQYPKN